MVRYTDVPIEADVKVAHHALENLAVRRRVPNLVGENVEMNHLV